jgi:hypothetical protein
MDTTTNTVSRVFMSTTAMLDQYSSQKIHILSSKSDRILIISDFIELLNIKGHVQDRY